MGTYTRNFRLYKPSATDYYNVETDQNANFEIIDAKLFELQTTLNRKEGAIEKKSGFNLEKSNAIDSSSEDTLATSLAVKRACESIAAGGNGKVNRSGDTMTGDLRMGNGKRFIAAHNYGYMCKDSSGRDKYIMYIDPSNRLHLGYENQSSIYFDTDTLNTRSGVVWHTGNFNPNTKVNTRGTLYNSGGNYSWVNLKNGGNAALIQDSYNGWNPLIRLKTQNGWFGIGSYSDTYQFNIVGFKDSQTANEGNTHFRLDLDGHGWINGNRITTTSLTSDNLIGIGASGAGGVIAGWSNEVNFSSSSDYIHLGYRKVGSGKTINTFIFGNGTNNGSGVGTIKAGNIISSGNIEASGTIRGSRIYNAVWNDYAEFFPKQKNCFTEPGDIIALKEDCDEEVYERATENHKVIVGVHSDQFAQLIGGEQPDDDTDFYEFNKEKYIPIGLAGRLLVKCVGVVKKGDKIVPSSIPGIGRVFTSGDLPEKVVGVALENKNSLVVEKIKIKI